MFGSLRYNIGTARNSNGPVPFACIKRKQGNFKPEVPFQNNTGLPWTASQKVRVKRHTLSIDWFNFYKSRIGVYLTLHIKSGIDATTLVIWANMYKVQCILQFNIDSSGPCSSLYAFVLFSVSWYDFKGQKIYNHSASRVVVYLLSLEG